MPKRKPPLTNAALPLVTPTYDGSGQATHPDILYFPAGWRGWEYWLALTPYPADDTNKENPSILVSHDGIAWQEPAGIVNPIALPATSFLADSDLVYDHASDQLWVYYIHQRVDGRTHVMRKTSEDGIHWGAQLSDPGISLFSVPDYELLSPAVAQVGERFWMWSVNTGSVGCHAVETAIEYRISPDGLHWSAPQPTTFEQPCYVPWHVDVIHVPEKGVFWMFVTAYPMGLSCHNTVLFFSSSTDGVHWSTYRWPALPPGIHAAWDRLEIYRATPLYDATGDRLRVWYAANDGPAWRIGYTERNYTEFLNLLMS